MKNVDENAKKAKEIHEQSGIWGYLWWLLLLEPVWRGEYDASLVPPSEYLNKDENNIPVEWTFCALRYLLEIAETEGVRHEYQEYEPMLEMPSLIARIKETPEQIAEYIANEYGGLCSKEDFLEHYEEIMDSAYYGGSCDFAVSYTAPRPDVIDLNPRIFGTVEWQYLTDIKVEVNYGKRPDDITYKITFVSDMYGLQTTQINDCSVSVYNNEDKGGESSYE